MIHNPKINFLVRIAIFITACGVFTIIWGDEIDAFAQGQGKTARAHSEAGTSQQPLYRDYKGILIGMTTEEVRSKLGEPSRKADDQDLYVISEKETAEFFYDGSHRVVAISVDYLGEGSGAPGYQEVIGPDVVTKPDGSMYKLVRYQQAGFWVSYNRTAGSSYIVTITIQKIH
ncbi:MAG: hypothetical protein ND866_13630 [Pyrinomonadaceae bacterium]|nr:hypothetical protein [Pyrinomonadaceae bacterium]